MLTRQYKQNIYDLLCHRFAKNQEIPLDQVTSYLKDQGFSYEEFGYKKMESLLSDLREFLTVPPSDSQGHEKNVVVFHNFQETPNIPTPIVTPIPMPTKAGLDAKAKDAILKQLSGCFIYGKEHPMASVSKFLLDKGVNYKNYGFSKMKTFLLAFAPEITLRNVNDKGVQQTFVLLKKANSSPRPAEVRIPVKTPVMPPVKIPEKTVAKQRPQRPVRKVHLAPTRPTSITEPPTIKGQVIIPSKLILSVKETTSLGLENASFMDLITSSYESAFQKKLVVVKDDALLFPIPLKSKEGEDLIASIKMAANGTPSPYYVNFIGVNHERPKDALPSQVHFSTYEDDIKALSLMARPEAWCYRHSKDPYIILKIYLQYTYYRLASQKKILVDDPSGFATFNTGLKTVDYDDIYGVMMKNSDKTINEPFIFQGFTIAGSQGLGKIIVEHFNPLPSKATYFSTMDDLIFNPAQEVHTDYQHIIFDNLDRFPMDFLKNTCLPFNEEARIVSQIAHETKDYARDRLFEKLTDDVRKNEVLFALIHTRLDMAIANSLKMIQDDYRLALPSFFPTRNVMSMMLPLMFNKSRGVEAVLLVERTPSGNYQGQTMFTLKQCYVNARLIGPLQNTFLKATDIDD